MEENGQNSLPSGTRVCSVDSASTCFPLDGPLPQEPYADGPCQASFSRLGHISGNVVEELVKASDSENGVADTPLTLEQAFIQRQPWRGSLLVVAYAVIFLLAVIAAVCSAYSAIKLTRETRDLRAAGRDVCRSQGGAIPSEVTGSGTSEETTEWWRSSTLPPGAVLPDFHGPNTSASASIASSVSVKDESFAVIGSPQTAVPLESLNTVPFEALLGISFIVLRLTDNEIRAYRVGTVSRNFSTSSTAIEFVTRETLLMQSDGLAVLLAPSNTILAGWNIEPGATPGAASGFHNQTNAVQAGIASESSSTETSVLSAVHPLTNAEVTEWLVRTKADHETDLSASVGQPLQPAPPVSGNAGSAEIPTSVFPLTDEEYKELDRGEPLLEGFPVVSLSADSPGTTAQDEQLAGSASETRQKTKFLENSAADTNPLAMETGALLPEAQDGLGDAATLR